MKLESLSIQNFRGIKSLSIPFGGKSWVIQGRNGSGKSAIIDAIEFALSGSISRLSGEGRGEVSVKEHGPHVDFRNTPKEAQVRLQVQNNSAELLTVRRHCESPTKFEIEPKSQKENWHSFGSEFVLSRREILKFVLTEPSERSKRVQAILKIEKLDKVRASLQTLKNKALKNFDAQTQAFNLSKAKLKESLQLTELKKEEVLAAVNGLRKTLGLGALSELNEKSRLTEGIKAEVSTAGYINKTELRSLYLNIQKILTSEAQAFELAAQEYRNQLAKLQGKETELKKIAHANFFEGGLKLIDSDECPFCDKDWDQSDLKILINEKIQALADVKKVKSELDAQRAHIKSYWLSLKTDAANFVSKTRDIKEIDASFFDQVEVAVSQLIHNENSEFGAPGDSLIGTGTLGLNIDQGLILTQLEKISQGLESIPEKSDEEKTKEILIVCQERIENYYQSAKAYEFHKNKSSIADKLLATFNEVAETFLNELYEDIQDDFSRFYQIVNSDDEANFRGQLTAENGALGFKVDFFGRGHFPPVAYHSEGHQDGMGLCLYLALMKKIKGDEFTFAILDDVLMSVDSDHRKNFCTLLKQEFPNTQFIITTHDKNWQKQMITEGLVSASTTLNFKQWTVDAGPAVWDEKDSWAEIDALIKKDNIPEAAITLRRFLEFMMDAVAVRLSASILRSPSGDYDLGALLMGTTDRFRGLLKKAQSSAHSWQDENLEATLEREKQDFADCLKRAQSEMWALDAPAYFDSWTKLGASEFARLRDAYFTLIQKLKCPRCDTFLHVIPAKGPSEAMKCDCNQRNYNLKERN